MDVATRKRLYNLCRPDEPLALSDPRFVDLDSLPAQVRGGLFASALAERILTATQPVCALVTAQRGAGLSTELRRLAAQLADPAGPNLLVAHIDAADTFDLTSTIHIADLLLALVQRVEKAVDAARATPALAAAAPGAPASTTTDPAGYSGSGTG